MYLKNKLTFVINSIKCTYKAINVGDVTKDYIATLKNDSGFIENANVTIDLQQKYINHIVDSKNDLLCGIFYDRILVGTSGIQLKGKSATIGILVFDKYRKIGLGKALVWASSTYVESFLNIKCFYAGVKQDNIPSIRSFLACGFSKFTNGDLFLFEANSLELITPRGISEVRIINNE